MPADVQQISPAILKGWLDDTKRKPPLLLDVREEWEFALCRIEGSQSMPMTTLISRWPELDPDLPVVVICHHGIRSYQVSAFLAHSGFSQPINLQGGVSAWANQVDPAMPRY